jgi:hypothetical protein
LAKATHIGVSMTCTVVVAAPAREGAILAPLREWQGAAHSGMPDLSIWANR